MSLIIIAGRAAARQSRAAGKSLNAHGRLGYAITPPILQISAQDCSSTGVTDRRDWRTSAMSCQTWFRLDLRQALRAAARVSPRAP